MVLGGGSLLAGLLPSCLRGFTARLSSGPGLSYLACYGGGVILATCFTHMMPEVSTLESVVSLAVTTYKKQKYFVIKFPQIVEDVK